MIASVRAPATMDSTSASGAMWPASCSSTSCSTCGFTDNTTIFAPSLAARLSVVWRTPYFCSNSTPRSARVAGDDLLRRDACVIRPLIIASPIAPDPTKVK